MIDGNESAPSESVSLPANAPPNQVRSIDHQRIQEGAERAAVRAVAAGVHADVDEVQCVAPPEVAAARIQARAARGDDASDADEVVAARMAARADPWPEAIDVPTLGPPDAVLARALARL